MTEFIDDNDSQINSIQYEGFEIFIQNFRNRVNLIENKSRTKDILINSVEEKSTGNAIQLITKVNQIIQDVDNTIHVTDSYRIGQTNNKFKPRPIIGCLELRSRNMQLLNKPCNFK